MGQRLNIEIIDNDVTLANCYYHWSGFTFNALALTEQILDHLDDLNLKDTTPLQKAIKLLMISGGNFTESECNKALKVEELKEIAELAATLPVNRNDGLIAFTSLEMENTRQWEEGRVTIDLSEKVIAFEALIVIDEEDFNVREDEADTQLVGLNHSVSEIPFEDFKDFAKTVNINEGDYFIDKDGYIFSSIY